MAETSNTAEMAIRLAEDLFAEFFWNRKGPIDQNWSCEEPDLHEKSTHPTDIVFYYDEPYSSTRTYVNCDLKSYAKNTIKFSKVKSALESMAMQVSCAEKSEQWRNLYVHDHVASSITGLLFVYNHDGEYDRNFQDYLHKIRPSDLRLPKKSKIVVLGPKDIFRLDNIRSDIQRMRGKANPELPGTEHCHFFYPQLVRRANIQGRKAKSATLEMLTSSLVFLEHKKEKKRGIIIYYSKNGAKTEEFLYLIEMLRVYQLLENDIEIRVKGVDAYENSPVVFQRAQQQYTEELSNNADRLTELSEYVLKIKYERISEIKRFYSDIELGMDR